MCYCTASYVCFDCKYYINEYNDDDIYLFYDIGKRHSNLQDLHQRFDKTFTGMSTPTSEHSIMAQTPKLSHGVTHKKILQDQGSQIVQSGIGLKSSTATIETQTKKEDTVDYKALFAIYAYNAKNGAVYVDDHITAVNETHAERVLVRRLTDKQFNNPNLVVKVTPLA